LGGKEGVQAEGEERLAYTAEKGGFGLRNKKGTNSHKGREIKPKNHLSRPSPEEKIGGGRRREKEKRVSYLERV